MKYKGEVGEIYKVKYKSIKLLNSFKIDSEHELSKKEFADVKTFFYKHNYGFPLSKWDRFTNRLWYYAGEKNELWAKPIYYPIHYMERIYYRVIDLIHPYKDD